MKREPLTRRQAQVFAFIKKFMADNEYPPSVTDICKKLGLWPNGVDQHLKLIAKKGYLRRVPNTARGIVIL